MDLKRVFSNRKASYAFEDSGSGFRLLRILNGRRTHDPILQIPDAFVENSESESQDFPFPTEAALITFVQGLPEVYEKCTRDGECYDTVGVSMSDAKILMHIHKHLR